MIAQKSSNSQSIPVTHHTTKFLLLVFLVLQVADLVTTIYGVGNGLVEHNTALVGASKHIGMVATIVIAKILCICGGIYFSRVYQGLISTVVLATADAFYVYIAIGNILAIVNG